MTSPEIVVMQASNAFSGMLSLLFFKYVLKIIVQKVLRGRC